MLAWLALGLVCAGFCAGVSYIMTLFLKTVVDGWIIGGFAVVGFIPGLLGACGQRFAGLLGFTGIFVGIVWGLVDAFIKKGAVWGVFVYFDILRAFFFALALGLLVQVFIKPRPANLVTKKTNPSHIQRPKPIRRSRAKRDKLTYEESKLYEV